MWYCMSNGESSAEQLLGKEEGEREGPSGVTRRERNLHVDFNRNVQRKDAWTVAFLDRDVLIFSTWYLVLSLKT